MAEFNKEQYTRTDIPICSVEYKKVLSDVKRNKIDIEDKDVVIKDLKKSFDELCVSRKRYVQPGLSVICVNDNSDSGICREEETSNEEKLLVDQYGSTVRQSIVTPGGTRRKGKTVL